MIARLTQMIRQRRARKGLYSTQAYWDSKAKTYDETAVSMWPNRSLNKLYEAEQVALVQTTVGEVRGRDLLDLGCGTGRFSRWFAQRGARVTGIDFSGDSLAIARRLSAGANPVYRQGSVFSLEDQNAYDLVFTWGVLTIACQTRDELLDSLRRIRRSLKPGGTLFLTEPVHTGFLHRVLDMGLNDFTAAMREAGFDVQAAVPLHFWPVRLMVGYFSVPAWITIPLYHVGQALMRVPGLSGLGDYWALVAVPAKEPA